MNVNKKDVEILLKINMELTEECDKFRKALEEIFYLELEKDDTENVIVMMNIAKHALEVGE